VSRGRTRGIGCRLARSSVAVALVGGLCACSSLPSISNPFSKEEEKLPGQRVAVITNPTLAEAPAVGKPISLPAPVTNADWTQPGGTPTNNLGHLTFGESLRKVWSADVGTGSSSRGRLSSVPLVVDGKVFTLDAAGTVSAFSAASGGKVWSASTRPDNEKSSEGFGGGLAYDGGRLFATTGFGTVVAFDPGNGAIAWTKKIGEPIRSSPTAAGGKIYFVATNNYLYCINAADGAELWKARGLPQPATLLNNVSPAVARSVVIAPYPAGDIAAYAAGSGEASWRESLSRGSETSASSILGDPARPVVDRGMVFAVSHGGRMIASSESTGERVWTRNIASTQMPWSAGDAVFVVDVSGKLLALSRQDGSVRWVTELPQGTRWSGPVLAGGRLWVVSGQGRLVGVDARSGQVGPQLDLDTPVFVSPIVAGGRMYILADNAQLIALN
jgi:outer membrane protein assembly factor BamB